MNQNCCCLQRVGCRWGLSPVVIVCSWTFVFNRGAAERGGFIFDIFMGFLVHALWLLLKSAGKSAEYFDFFFSPVMLLIFKNQKKNNWCHLSVAVRVRNLRWHSGLVWPQRSWEYGNIMTLSLTVKLNKVKLKIWKCKEKWIFFIKLLLDSQLKDIEIEVVVFFLKASLVSVWIGVAHARLGLAGTQTLDPVLVGLRVGYRA